MTGLTRAISWIGATRKDSENFPMRVDLDRFTVDRLITIVNRLGRRVEVSVK